MGPWMSPRDVESRRQVGASMLEQKVTKLTKGERLGLRRRRIRAGNVGGVPMRLAALARGATTENG